MWGGISEGRKSSRKEKKNKRRGPPGVLIAAFRALRHSSRAAQDERRHPVERRWVQWASAVVTVGTNRPPDKVPFKRLSKLGAQMCNFLLL